MKKFFTLAITMAFLSALMPTKVWAATATVSGLNNKVANNEITWNGNHVTFKFSGEQISKDNRGYIQIYNKKNYGLSWATENGYSISVSGFSIDARASLNGGRIYIDNTSHTVTYDVWERFTTITHSQSKGNNETYSLYPNSSKYESSLNYFINQISVIYDISTINYTLSFDKNDNGNNNSPYGSEVNDMTVEKKYTFPADPQRTGYNFIGWFTDRVDGVQKTTNDTYEYGDRTLYAHWEAKTYTISYNTNGGDNLGNSTVTYDAPYDLSTPTRTGYTFVKWQKDGKDFVKEDTDTYTFTNNITLTAVWTPNTYNLTLDYNDNNVTANNTITVTYDDQYNLGEPTRTGYTFIGWYDANNKEFATSGTYKTDGDITLTAHWEANKYNVTLNYNGNGTANNTIQVTYDDQYDLGEPTRTGYTFKGWYDANNNVFATTGIYKKTEGITLTAHWEANKYTISYNTNGGDNLGNSTVTYDAPYDLSTPTRTGYTFAGWQKDGKDFVKEDTDTYTFANDITLTAVWAPNTYDLILDYNYTNAPANATHENFFTYGATYDIDIKEMPGENIHPVGYHFDGWYTNEACTQAFSLSGTYKTDGNTTIYAKWTINTYTLTFELNGGSWNNVNVPNNQTTITYNKTFGELLDENKIQRSDYTFLGWYSDENFSKKVVSKDIVSEYPPLTLYAKWKINDLTVKFDANYPNNRQGEAYTVSKKVNSGQLYTLPTSNPSIAGYTFTGWKTEYDTKVDAYTVCRIGVDHTLYGCWEAITYTVTYSPNQGNWSGSIQSMVEELTYDQAYGQDNKFPADPTREGYTFQGWWTEDGSQQVTATTRFETANDQTLYAHWSSNNYKLIFDYKDEAGTFEAVDVTYDAKYPTVNKVPTRVGFTFVGWYDANNNEVILSDLPSRTYTTAGNERFFAHWKPNHYTVKFKTGADSKVIDSMSVAYHDVYGILPKVKENGREVPTEWYDAPANGMLITPTTIFQPANVNDNQDFILYATTNPKKFALQLVDGNQTTTIGISEGQTYAQALEAAGINKEETGKTFLGWSATQDGTTPKDLSEGFSTDCQTLYALWEKTQLLVSFADGEHTNADYGVLTLAYGDTYGTGTRLNAAQAGLPSVAEVTGKTFKGWAYADNMFVNNTTPATFTKADHTLTAVWMANNYTIYLHDAQANKTSTIDVTYGADYTLATPAAVNGYTFDGWYEDNKSTAFAHNGTYTQSADIHLYAHWTAVSGIPVSFDANGGTKADNISATYGQDYGVLPTTTKAGYTFVGWFTAAEGGTEVTNTTICKQTADHTLYAHWTANNFTIYLHENTGVDKTSAIDVTYGGNYTLTAPAERTGYTFAGWFTKQEGGDRYDLTTRTYETVGDLHLYAQWTAVSGITVSFNADGGEAVTNSFSATYGQVYGVLPTTTKKGYTFVGWFNADGNIVASTDICRNATSHTLTAHWTAKAYTITFDANGGECHTANKQVVYNTAIGKLPLATRDGYKFNGWWAYGATKATTEADIFAGFDNLTLKADWEACQYTVSFLPEGGTTTADNKQVTYQAEYGDLPTATRDGYTFDGWFTCDNESITSDTKYTNIGDQELHAHWTAKKYTVTFSVPDKATLSTPSMEVTFNSPYGELPTPTLAGYEFTGWYSAELLGSGSLVTSTSTVSTASNHNLYARWTGADVTIHFNSNGGSEVADVTRKYQANYCEPALPTPTKEGYTLIGWYFEDGTLVTSTTTVDRTEAHTLTAYWAQANVPYLVLGDNWKISSPEADNDYRFKLGQDGLYHLSNIRVKAESSFEDGGTGTTVYQASVTIFLNGVFYGVEQEGQTKVLQTTENGNSGSFTANSSERATIQSAEMLTRWFNFDLYEVSSGTWQLSISCGKQGNPTEVDNNESEQPARAKKYVEDGKVFIQTKEDRIYNASGQLVK